MMAAVSGRFLLVAAGLAAAAQVSEPLETVTLAVPTEGTPFNNTVPACGTVPPFVVIGVPNASFTTGTHTMFLPPQASAIATSFTQKVGGWNATEVIIATPRPGTCGPLSPSTSHSHSLVLPTPPPAPSGNSSSSPFLPFTNTSSLCPVHRCAEDFVSSSARHITGFLRELTLATQKLDFAALELGGSGGSPGTGPSRNIRRAELEPRYSNILEALIFPLEDLVDTIRFSLHFLSSHSALPDGCDTDSIASAARGFVDAQRTLAQILLEKADSLFGGARSSRRDAGRDTRDSPSARDLLGDDEGSRELFHVPFLGSLIQGALKIVKRGVDELVVDLISILPARAECLVREVEALDEILAEAIAAFD